MTANQIAYWNLQETKRANLAREAENYRSNTAKEDENHRSNTADEYLGLRKQAIDAGKNWKTMLTASIFDLLNKRHPDLANYSKVNSGNIFTGSPDMVNKVKSIIGGN